MLLLQGGWVYLEIEGQQTCQRDHPCPAGWPTLPFASPQQRKSNRRLHHTTKLNLLHR